MIIGYSIFNNGFHSNYFDTALPTSQIDELTIGSGIYDELYLTLDTTVSMVNEKPSRWFLKTIINPKFKEDIEAGTLDADGHKITELQVYRQKFGEETDWTLIGRFSYEFEHNVYSFIDNSAENGATYRYAIVPIASEIVGELNVSQPVAVEYQGVYLSDNNHNFRLEIDFEMGPIVHNKNFSTMTPLNGRFPVLVYGNQDYRTGEVKFLSVTKNQIETGGTKIDSMAERVQRDAVVNFLNNGQAKILRNDNGEVMIIATSGVKSVPKDGRLMDIHSVEFDYTEIGKVNSQTMTSTGLLGDAMKSSYTYDERGEVVWEI